MLCDSTELCWRARSALAQARREVQARSGDRTLRPTVCHLSLPKEGEAQNGDAVLIREDGSRMLLALVDALGHGPGASAVAAVAVAELEAAPLGGGLAPILDRLHRGLRHSRGAAALVCTIDDAGR